MKSEQELLNEALMAYSLGYPWRVECAVIYALTNSFFSKLYNEMHVLGIACKVESRVTNQSVFTRPITTVFISRAGKQKVLIHRILLQGYKNDLDYFRRGFEPE